MRKGFALLLVLSLAFPILHATPRNSQSVYVNDTIKQALVEAILDEIYDYNYQGEFADTGVMVDPNHMRLPVYIQPRLEDGHAQTIYKLMPYGEIIRSFQLDKNGLVVLLGDPEEGFPASLPNFRTVYMDDDRVCQLKKDWIRSYFDVDMAPSRERIEEASKHQMMRVGFSARQAHKGRLRRD